ncbi:MAG: cobyrinate a,c-diamide synthase [Pseudomonadota bacterium]
MAPRALILAAPQSGAGKTLVTLGLLRAFARAGREVRGAKSGPDYIDPAFHQAACGQPSVNLDAFAMTPPALRAYAQAQGGTLVLIEGAMGVLDGAADGTGSVADLAVALDVPVVLILDIARSAQSASLAVAGLRALRPEVQIAGVILNNVASDRHAVMAREALHAAGARVFGALPRRVALHLPSRHLGLVQAGERDLSAILETAADWAEAVDLDALAKSAAPLGPAGRPHQPPQRLLPLGARIAVARDTAFAFAYPHLLSDWHAQGAEILPFSPLADEAPAEHADAVFLPGGYPELHAGPLSANTQFLSGLRRVAETALVYGECGGFMVLGEALICAQGTRHPMAGLLPVTTSFATPKRHLGYRQLHHQSPLPWPADLTGHEFHYSTLTQQGACPALFEATDALGTDLGPMGCQMGRICGSYGHVIAPRKPTTAAA